MNITRNNYEEYFIDYHDKTLTAEQVAELFLFLESNPDLKDEFNSFSSVAIDAPELEFPFRESMKRGEINEQNFSWYMAANVEGDLSSDEKLLLDNFLKNNPRFSADAHLFISTKLEAGNEEFPNKKSLKQPVPFVFNFTRTLNYAVAAMLFLSLIGGSYYLYTQSLVKTGNGVAELPKEEPASNVLTPVEENRDIQLAEENTTVPKKGTALSETHMASAVTPKKAAANAENKLPANDPLKSPVVDEAPQIAEVVAEKTPVEEPLVANNAPANSSQVNSSSEVEEEYLSVWEAIRQGAEKNLRKAIDEGEPVASSDDPDGKRIRIIDVVSKGVSKISNDKVSVDAAYADNGKVSGFRFAAGKFSIERTQAD